MKLIVGLGNHEPKYKNNRHNMGFMAIDYFADSKGVELNKNKFNGVFYKGDNFIIGKPHTFMNLSGDFVQEISSFFKIKTEDILIIYDDMDMEIGKLRYREVGSSGGQNGIKDIMLKMGTNNIDRLKIGIGRPDSYASNYVLEDFTKEQKEIIESKKSDIVKYIEEFINN